MFRKLSPKDEGDTCVAASTAAGKAQHAGEIIESGKKVGGVAYARGFMTENIEVGQRPGRPCPVDAVSEQ
ncbi:hypothetical protein [Streptomyces sp. NPDC090021]|uniref:hypothetical protein n=1 Tax=Streptomyces sp. NPDC090021 TaxID=3365919 RepID=UPI00382F72D8